MAEARFRMPVSEEHAWRNLKDYCDSRGLTCPEFALDAAPGAMAEKKALLIHLEETIRNDQKLQRSRRNKLLSYIKREIARIAEMQADFPRFLRKLHKRGAKLVSVEGLDEEEN